MWVQWALSDDWSPHLGSYLIILSIMAEALVPFVNQYHSKPLWDIQPIRPLNYCGWMVLTSWIWIEDVHNRAVLLMTMKLPWGMKESVGFKKIIKIAMRKIIISCEDYIYLLKCFSPAFWTKSRSESFYTSFPLDLDVPIADSWTYLAFK